jgi:hypothetical protein
MSRQSPPRALIFCRTEPRRGALMAAAIACGWMPEAAASPLEAVFALQRQPALVVVANAEGDDDSAAFVQFVLDDSLADNVCADASVVLHLPETVRPQVHSLDDGLPIRR